MKTTLETSLSNIDLALLAQKNVVYAFVNDEDKMFYIGQSTSLSSGVHHLVTHLETDRYKLMQEHKSKLKLYILETEIEDIRMRKHDVYHYRNMYLKKGYKEYVKTKYTRYRVKLETGTYLEDKNTYYFVNLYDSRNTRTILGAFHSEKDAYEWADKCYPLKDGERVIKRIVINDYYLTRRVYEYLKLKR